MIIPLGIWYLRDHYDIHIDELVDGWHFFGISLRIKEKSFKYASNGYAIISFGYGWVALNRKRLIVKSGWHH